MADPKYTAESRIKQCSVDGCARGLRAKGLCGKHYQRVYVHGSIELPQKAQVQWAGCSVDGCKKPSRTILGRYCEMHYCRMRRNGTHAAPVWFQWAVNTSGYVMKRDVEHPIASKSGYLYQHRAVLFEAMGFGVHQCHWCGCEIEWKAKGKRKLVVDHLDGNKVHNDISNLKASCSPCNANRGLFQAWVMKHRNDPFLWALCDQAKRAA